jgi:hypothetical protein
MLLSSNLPPCWLRQWGLLKYWLFIYQTIRLHIRDLSFLRPLKTEWKFPQRYGLIFQRDNNTKTFPRWKWRQQYPPKRPYLFTNIHGFTYQGKLFTEVPVSQIPQMFYCTLAMRVSAAWLHCKLQTSPLVREGALHGRWRKVIVTQRNLKSCNLLHRGHDTKTDWPTGRRSQYNLNLPCCHGH